MFCKNGNILKFENGITKNNITSMKIKKDIM